jgi:hypothetical protein
MVLCKAASREALVWGSEFGSYKKDAEKLFNYVLEYY